MSACAATYIIHALMDIEASLQKVVYELGPNIPIITLRLLINYPELDNVPEELNFVLYRGISKVQK